MLQKNPNHCALFHVQGGRDTLEGLLLLRTLSWQIPCPFYHPETGTFPPGGSTGVTSSCSLIPAVRQHSPIVAFIGLCSWQQMASSIQSLLLLIAYLQPALERTSDQDQGYHRVASWPSEIRCLLMHKQVGNLYTIKNSSAWLEPLVPARFKATHKLRNSVP